VAGAGRNLTGDHDVMLAATINSDIVPGEGHQALPSRDGRWLTFRAPIDGSFELWRVATGDGALERLTTGRHAIGGFDQVELAGAGGVVRTAWLRSSPTELNDLWVRDGQAGAPRRRTALNRDALAGVDSLVAEGLADPARLGVTGGSYGGYLTTWIVGHDDRFAAAMTCRSVSDMALLMLTGDISSGFWASYEFRTTPWDDPAYFREISPITYADRIRTPLLIQHSEN